MNININIGLDLVLQEEFTNLLCDKIKELRYRLKNNDDIDMPEISVMDNLNIGKKEVGLLIDNNIAWKQEFDNEEFGVITDIIIENLKDSQIKKRG